MVFVLNTIDWSVPVNSNMELTIRRKIGKMALSMERMGRCVNKSVLNIVSKASLTSLFLFVNRSNV